MERTFRAVGFWVAVGLVAIVARPIAQTLAIGPVGAAVPGLRKLLAT